MACMSRTSRSSAACAPLMRPTSISTARSLAVGSFPRVARPPGLELALYRSRASSSATWVLSEAASWHDSRAFASLAATRPSSAACS
eukprot:6083201-Pyramimonas_sp.AAC.1